MDHYGLYTYTSTLQQVSFGGLLGSNRFQLVTCWRVLVYIYIYRGMFERRYLLRGRPWWIVGRNSSVFLGDDTLQLLWTKTMLLFLGGVSHVQNQYRISTGLSQSTSNSRFQRSYQSYFSTMGLPTPYFSTIGSAISIMIHCYW